MNTALLKQVRFAAFALLWITGCSSGPAPVEVAGDVTLDGQPVEGAVVTLILEEGAGPSYSGTTDAGGAFTVEALPGNYKVTLIKPEIGPNPAQSALPDLYRHPTSTPFRCTAPLDERLRLALTRAPSP